jgi:peptidoglycan/LPS O-acetylase OafA/YrhL
MPVPTEGGRRYVAGLDGIRALAVMCVIAYHLGFSWAGGGMLGVGVFFTLSGYLITDLLLTHWRRHGELGLRSFWIHRARRLLPALFVMLAVTSVATALVDPGMLSGLRRQVLSSSLYFANWSTIAQHGSYFGQFATPLPLDHLWSLSIEEQFYLVWPILLLGGIWVLRGRRRLALATLVLAAGSALAMALAYHAGYDPTRAYEGTDTRAFGLLIGVALAFVWPSDTPRMLKRPQVRKALDVVGVTGLVAILLLVAETNAFTSFLYPYGFLLLSVGTAALIMATVNPTSQLGRALGCRPLRWIGVRSYGIYLWQWPIIVLAAPAAHRFQWGRASVEVVAILVVAALSWRFVEEPVRHGVLARLARRARGRVSVYGPRRSALALSGAAAALICLPALALGGALPVLSGGRSGSLLRVLPAPLTQARATIGSRRGTSGHTVAAAHGQRPAHHAGGSSPPPGSATMASMPVPLFGLTTSVSTHSSCRSVVYIGDSTSEGEISTNYIPRTSQRIQSQLARVGVRTFHSEISGARSTVETYQGHPNADTVAKGYVGQGYHGCWILAIGTNDVANVQLGGKPGLAGRIARLMAIVGHAPVMWVDLVTLVAPGSPYAESGMEAWNRSLVAACRRYPNMRIFDWAGLARRKWFIPDGIHYYSPGYVARSHLISGALAEAFPAKSHQKSSCLVG